MDVFSIGCLAAAALVINLATFLAYGMDKAAAEDGRRRIPEKVLLQLALIGGSPAALLACHIFRHKTRKQPFKAILLSIPFIQLAAVVGRGVGYTYSG